MSESSCLPATLSLVATDTDNIKQIVYPLVICCKSVGFTSLTSLASLISLTTLTLLTSTTSLLPGSSVDLTY